MLIILLDGENIRVRGPINFDTINGKLFAIFQERNGESRSVLVVEIMEVTNG